MRSPRNLHLWLPGYLQAVRRRRSLPPSKLIHILFCVCDHFEPAHGAVDEARQSRRVAAWQTKYPAFDRYRDSDGRHPQHTFFYPIEQYRYDHAEQLGRLVERGFGEVEVHLHHDNDTAEHFSSSIREFVHALHRDHGFFSVDPVTSSPSYAFIHGNWALDNARPDGRWCGLNDEIDLLLQTGCYADFTLPSAPDITQTRTVNSIYYAVDDPGRPKSHDTGTPVTVGTRPPERGLMIVQGPLALDWGRRKGFVLPRLDNAAIDASNPPAARRVPMWLRAGISVVGRPDWICVKLHTHGAPELNAAALLDGAMGALHAELTTTFNSDQYRLHYVTARELFNIIKAAEDGKEGDPRRFRDFLLPPPARVH